MIHTLRTSGKYMSQAEWKILQEHPGIWAHAGWQYLNSYNNRNIKSIFRLCNKLPPLTRIRQRLQKVATRAAANDLWISSPDWKKWEATTGSPRTSKPSRRSKTFGQVLEITYALQFRTRCASSRASRIVQRISGGISKDFQASPTRAAQPNDSLFRWYHHLYSQISWAYTKSERLSYGTFSVADDGVLGHDSRAGTWWRFIWLPHIPPANFKDGKAQKGDGIHGRYDKSPRPLVSTRPKSPRKRELLARRHQAQSNQLIIWGEKYVVVKRRGLGGTTTSVQMRYLIFMLLTPTCIATAMSPGLSIVRSAGNQRKIW